MAVVEPGTQTQRHATAAAAETAGTVAVPRPRPMPLSSTSRLPVADDVLKRAAAKQIRRSMVGPDFLKDYATKALSAKTGPPSVAASQSSKIKVVTGKEASRMYKDYVQEAEAAEATVAATPGTGTGARDVALRRNMSMKPVVFAFPVQETGRKVMDMWMTWRGKVPGTNQLKGSKRRRNFLDTEFKRFTRGMNKEYKRLSQFSGDVPDVLRTDATPRLPPPSKVPELTPLPPPQPIPASRPAITKSGSVQSLPYLNQVPNVPIGNRLPLRLANPDARSDAGTNRDSILGKTPFTPTIPPPVLQPSPLKVDAAPLVEAAHEKRSSTPSSSSTENSFTKRARKYSKINIIAPQRSASDSSGGSGFSFRRSKKENKLVSDALDDAKEEAKRLSDGSELVFVILDDKDKRAWHSVPSTKHKSQTPERTSSSRRNSPWNGPPVHTEGIIHHNNSAPIIPTVNDLASPVRKPSLTRRADSASLPLSSPHPQHDPRHHPYPQRYHTQAPPYRSPMNHMDPESDSDLSDSDSDDESDSEDDDDDEDEINNHVYGQRGPMIPVRTFLATMGYTPPTPEMDGGLSRHNSLPVMAPASYAAHYPNSPYSQGGSVQQQQQFLSPYGTPAGLMYSSPYGSSVSPLSHASGGMPVPGPPQQYTPFANGNPGLAAFVAASPYSRPNY